MSGALSIVEDLRSAQRVLIESSEASAHRVAHMLDLFLSGTSFEEACGLHGPWRSTVQEFGRRSALIKLIERNPDVSDRCLAKRIADALKRSPATSLRPDGDAGYVADLIANDCPRSAESLRKSIAALRGLKNPWP